MRLDTPHASIVSITHKSHSKAEIYKANDTTLQTAPTPNMCPFSYALSSSAWYVFLSLQNFSQETSRFVALNYLLGKIHFLYASIAPHENPLSLPLPFDAEIVHYSIILLLVLEFLKIICYVPFTFLSPAFTLKSSTL